jgi:hypothetical protein
VRDWRRYGGGAGGSPVHSSRLTALYFPGALRDAAPPSIAAGIAGREGGGQP